MTHFLNGLFKEYSSPSDYGLLSFPVPNFAPGTPIKSMKVVFWTSLPQGSSDANPNAVGIGIGDSQMSQIPPPDEDSTSPFRFSIEELGATPAYETYPTGFLLPYSEETRQKAVQSLATGAGHLRMKYLVPAWTSNKPIAVLVL